MNKSKKCAYCDQPAITNLDDDDLCEEHANAWCRAEERAYHEAEEEMGDQPYEAIHGW